MSRVARIVKDNDLIPTRLLFDPFGSRMKVYHDGHHFVGIKSLSFTILATRDIKTSLI